MITIFIVVSVPCDKGESSAAATEAKRPRLHTVESDLLQEAEDGTARRRDSKTARQAPTEAYRKVLTS